VHEPADGTALRASPDDGFRLVFEHASDGIFIANGERFTAVNLRGCELLGYAPGELDGQLFTCVVPPEDLPALYSELSNMLEVGLARREWSLVKKDGSRIEVESTSQLLPDGRFIAMVRDIGGLRKAQRELDATRAALRSLVNALPSPAFIVDRDFVVLMCNDALAEALGLAMSEVVGQSAVSMLPPRVAADRLARLREVFASGLRMTFDDDSGGRHYRNHIYPVVGADGVVERVAIFAIDVTDIFRAETALRLSEERMRATLDGRPDVAVQWYDREGRVRLWNRASERMFGFTAAEAIDKPLVELIYTPEQQAEFLAGLEEIANTGVPIGPVELPFRHRDGTQGACLSTMFEIPGEHGVPYFVCMDVDLTERKRVEAELRQAQKEEVLGRLAGGMAHDFNNLLTAIVGFAELGLARVPRGSEPSECFEFVLEAAQRGAGLTGNLLAFARKKVVLPRSIVLREVVDRLMPLMRPLIGEHIDLTTHHEPGPEHVTIDVGSVEQVIMNLVVNARDAMPVGGRLTIETYAVTLHAAESPKDLQPGRYVVLAVKDTGVGVPLELHARVFEPFFTTKSVGQGTGLGLATCAGIVRQAGGHIGLESGPSGTTFKVHLSVTPASKVEPAAVRDARERVRGDETILLVEDEPSVRVLMQRVLRSLGYQVMIASEGREALEVAAAFAGKIHLLLTDLVMPEMGGLELAEAMAIVRPETRVLLCSGYASDPDLANRKYALLPKPYAPALLAQRVRDTLDA